MSRHCDTDLLIVTDPIVVQSEFDRLAAVEDLETFSHSGFYYPWLLRQLPRSIGCMAEIGCGGGMLTNLLAPRTEKLLAIDLSSSMLDRARTRCSRWPHVLFTQFDAHAWTPEPASLDAIVTVATFHHLRADNVLPRWITALRPGGVLLIHDILDRPGLMNLPLNVAAATADRYLRWLRTGSFRTDPAVRAAWATHASFDRLPTIHDVHRFVDTYLPGAHIKHHLLWRYTVRWQKH